MAVTLKVSRLILAPLTSCPRQDFQPWERDGNEHTKFRKCICVQVFTKQTRRGNNMVIIHVALRTIHNYGRICQRHQAWEHALTVENKEIRTG
jgi:hypothetical protein